MQGEQFVRKVKARAAELSIPMSDLYRDCKITSGTMSQWKKGLTNPRFTNIIKLAEYLKTTPEYLFGKTKEVETETPALSALTGYQGGLQHSLPNDDQSHLHRTA